MKFTEEKLEKAFTELFGNENFPHHFGITMKRTPQIMVNETEINRINN